MSASRSTLRPRGRVAVGSDLDPLPLIAPVVHGHVALAARFGPLDGPADLARDEHSEYLFGRHLELGAEATTDVRRDHAYVLLGDAGRERQHHAEDVRYLGSGPERDLVGHVGADHRAWLHGARDEPLLAVLALNDDRGAGEGRVDIAGDERPLVALVACLVDLGRTLLQCRPYVEHGLERLVGDVDRGQRIRCRIPVARDDDGYRLADVADLIGRQWRVRRDHDVRRHRPRAGQAAQFVAEVRRGERGDDARNELRRADVNRGNPGVGVRAAQERHVLHARQDHVVGPAGLAGHQPGVFLPGACPADLRDRRFGGGGHWPAPACAARRTARTMFS